MCISGSSSSGSWLEHTTLGGVCCTWCTASDCVKNCISSSSGDGISTVGSGRAVNRNIGVSSSTCGGSSTGGIGNIGASSSSSGRSS